MSDFIFEFLEPVSQFLQDYARDLPKFSIGRSVKFNASEFSFLSLGGSTNAVFLFSVDEYRNSVSFSSYCESCSIPDVDYYSSFRKSFYILSKGNWSVHLIDLGSVVLGNSIEDTYYAVSQIVQWIDKAGGYSFIIGGSQDLTLAQYRGLIYSRKMFNLAIVDSKCDIAPLDISLNNLSYISKIIVDDPHYLLNCSILGYQSYLNAQDTLKIMVSLGFDTVRIGELFSDIALVEPFLRHANILSVDLSSVRSSDIGGMFANPNGFTAREFCALSRYSGMSYDLRSVGVYELVNQGSTAVSQSLLAQFLWYFIEGISCKVIEDLHQIRNTATKYLVDNDLGTFTFYKSEISGRWWVEFPFHRYLNNKFSSNTLLACSLSDYKLACNQEIPQRWYQILTKSQV